MFNIDSLRNLFSFCDYNKIHAKDVPIQTKFGTVKSPNDIKMIKTRRLNISHTTIGLLLMIAWRERQGALLINSPVTQNVFFNSLNDLAAVHRLF